MSQTAFPDDHIPLEITDKVTEVAGPAFTALETTSAISLGVLCLVGAGLLSLLLSALADEHRLSVAGIGQAAMLEALSMGLSTALAGILLKPVRLRTIGIVAALAMAGANLGTLRASGASVFAIRALAGVPEGVLLWICVGLISRTATPERWAGFLFTGMGATQLAAASAVSVWALPRYGANGGYAALAGISLLCLPFALATPSSYGAVPGSETAATGAPPPRGWIALAATMAYAAAQAAVTVYLIPLAREAGLDIAAGRTAVSVLLACQIAGGALATLLAGRISYISAFWGCSAALALGWGSFALHLPAALFIAAAGLSGGAAMMSGPFFVPMTIEADPSRRAAVQSGAVQVLAGALGPFLASLLVSDRDAHGVLVLSLGLTAAGLAVFLALHRAARKG
jgi:hypothetical protein